MVWGQVQPVLGTAAEREGKWIEERAAMAESSMVLV
jgi:hypothetical protein